MGLLLQYVIYGRQKDTLDPGPESRIPHPIRIRVTITAVPSNASTAARHPGAA